MSPLIYLVPVCIIGAVFLIIMATWRGKSDLAKRLSELETTKPALAQATHEVALKKVLEGGRHDKLQQKLIEGGWYSMTPIKFVARCVIGALVGGGAGLALIVYGNHYNSNGMMLVAIAAGYGGYKPMFDLNAAIKRRQTEVQMAIPNLLDLLSSTVSAGVALNGALHYAVEAISGALHDELASTLSDIRLGSPRGEALMALANRLRVPDLTMALRAIVQAEKLGTNMATMLSELADDSRARRLMLAEEMGASLPVKMSLPMVLFMLPALLSLIAGLAAAEVMSPFVDAQLRILKGSIGLH